MAKVAQKAGQVPATRRDQVPATRAQRLERAAGRGVSTDRDDKIIPMIRVLQSQSPQCLKQKPEYLGKDAEAGVFWFKGAAKELVDGKVGFEFIPCYFTKAWLQFDGPRDKSPNFVARHEDRAKRPADVPGLELDEDGYDYVNKAGHRWSLSREFYGLVRFKGSKLWGMWLLPFSGGGHTTAREWQTLMDNFVLPSGRPEPSYNRRYLINTIPKSNSSGDWFGMRYVMQEEVTDDEFDLAEAFHLACASGAVRGEAPDAPLDNEADSKI